jgi:hypothetical protein
VANEWLYILQMAENAIFDHALYKSSSSEFLYLGRYEKPLIFKVATRENNPRRQISAAGPEASAGTGRKEGSGCP